MAPKDSYSEVESLWVHFGVMIATISAYGISHMINIGSRDLGVVFNITDGNLGMYIAKLNSIRNLAMLLGSVLECIIYAASEFNRAFLLVPPLSGMVMIRIILIILMRFPRNISVDAYIALIFDGFFFGFFQASFIGIFKEFASLMMLYSSFLGFSVPFIRLLECFVPHVSLLFIRVQLGISIFTGMISLVIFIYVCDHEDVEGYFKEKEESKEKDEKETKDKPVSSVIMILGMMIKVFLYPAIIPYAILKVEDVNIINNVYPLVCLIGSAIVAGLDGTIKKFDDWEKVSRYLLILILPMIVVLVSTLMAIHTKISFFHDIIDSKVRVMVLCSVLFASYSIIRSASYAGIQKYASSQKKGKYPKLIVVYYIILSLMFDFIFSKISIGYNDVRILRRYCFPDFYGDPRMEGSKLFFSIVKDTFGSGLHDFLGEFKLNIRLYL